ncbi:MAG: exodeoxyribonuclease VII small subunit [Spirochaetia bacterium]|nr:exodeoxyribonuclease VII small subunit [Spirochaetia bacterium]
MESFENKIARLEELNAKMKESGISIEDAMKYFSEGTKLAASLEKEISKMERKVEILLNKPDAPDEKPDFGLFPELSSTEEN